jgi:hypothetical protein
MHLRLLDVNYILGLQFGQMARPDLPVCARNHLSGHAAPEKAAPFFFLLFSLLSPHQQQQQQSAAEPLPSGHATAKVCLIELLGFVV